MKRRLESGESTNCSSMPKSNYLHGLGLIQQYNDGSESSNSEDECPPPNRSSSKLKLTEYELFKSLSGPEQEKKPVVDTVGANLKTEISTLSKIKKTKRLELPSAVVTMFRKAGDDDPSKYNEIESIHEGRIRSFPHVRGNWASYVYIPFGGPNDGVESTSTMSTLLLDRFHSANLKMRFNPSFHLSLSRTVVFHHHWLEPFIQDLKTHLEQMTRFQVVFEEYDVFVNDEKTRTFIGMKLHSCPELHDLVDICDSCLKEYNLESYYKDRQFHISLGWVLGDQYDKIRKFLPELNETWQYISSCNPYMSCYSVDTIEFKYGNKLSHFNLVAKSKSTS